MNITDAERLCIELTLASMPDISGGTLQEAVSTEGKFVAFCQAGLVRQIHEAMTQEQDMTKLSEMLVSGSAMMERMIEEAGGTVLMANNIFVVGSLPPYNNHAIAQEYRRRFAFPLDYGESTRLTEAMRQADQYVTETTGTTCVAGGMSTLRMLNGKTSKARRLSKEKKEREEKRKASLAEHMMAAPSDGSASEAFEITPDDWDLLVKLLDGPAVLPDEDVTWLKSCGLVQKRGGNHVELTDLAKEWVSGGGSGDSMEPDTD